MDAMVVQRRSRILIADDHPLFCRGLVGALRGERFLMVVGDAGSEDALTLSHSIDDIRWYRVTDKAGDELGKINEILIDEQDRKVRFVRIELGGILGIGITKALIPAESIGSDRGRGSTSERAAPTHCWRTWVQPGAGR